MVNRKRTKTQERVNTTPHRKQNIEQHQTHRKSGISGVNTNTTHTAKNWVIRTPLITGDIKEQSPSFKMISIKIYIFNDIQL